MVETAKLIHDIEDHLVPRLRLDVGEARLYYHLLRHSRLIEKHEVIVSVAQLCEAMNCSKNAVKPRLRSLADKGVVEIMNTGWAGTTLKVFMPREIPGVIPEASGEASIEIEALDFYKDPRYRPAIFEREGGRCFYCRRSLSDGDYGLDHVVPQVERGSSSYRNVVAACHSCNSSKGDTSGADHVRTLYRRGFLGPADLEERLAQLEKLMTGQLRPIIR
jgi:predicted DNA-binding transcriptional regulator